MATLIGLTILFIIGCIVTGLGIWCLITGSDKILVCVLAIIMGVASIIIGICGFVVYEKSPQKEIQIEVQHPLINEDYNYCPYCGKEIK